MCQIGPIANTKTAMYLYLATTTTVVAATVNATTTTAATGIGPRRRTTDAVATRGRGPIRRVSINRDSNSPVLLITENWSNFSFSMLFPKRKKWNSTIQSAIVIFNVFKQY